MKTSMPSKNTTTKAPPAPWATRSGQDTFGAYADLELRGQVQRFRWCQPGRFVMGDAEQGRRNVTLTRGFWMGDTPVTQGLYAAVMGWNPSEFRSALSFDFPVEMVSWHDAQEMVQAVNRLIRSDSFRLPTEAEWEYAARAGTTGERYGPVEEIAWTAENSLQRPYSVGQRRPNPWGLYDTLGNVWEWVEDVREAYPPGDLLDPKGPDSGPYRVVRGGSWNFDPRYARVADRLSDEPGYRDDDLGLRLVRTGP
jgi:formylglycine-generating enzyme required for sulfatase activity